MARGVRRNKPTRDFRRTDDHSETPRVQVASCVEVGTLESRAGRFFARAHGYRCSGKGDLKRTSLESTPKHRCVSRRARNSVRAPGQETVPLRARVPVKGDGLSIRTLMGRGVVSRGAAPKSRSQKAPAQNGAPSAECSGDEIRIPRTCAEEPTRRGHDPRKPERTRSRLSLPPLQGQCKMRPGFVESPCDRPVSGGSSRIRCPEVCSCDPRPRVGVHLFPMYAFKSRS